MALVVLVAGCAGPPAAPAAGAGEDGGAVVAAEAAPAEVLPAGGAARARSADPLLPVVPPERSAPRHVVPDSVAPDSLEEARGPAGSGDGAGAGGGAAPGGGVGGAEVGGGPGGATAGGAAAEGGSVVARAQERLAALRYYAGPVDGVRGPATTTAVQAFQKVQGLAVDGVLGPATLAALDDPVLPALHAGVGDRIEIDLDAQVLYAVLGGELARIMPISSGNGEGYSLPGGGRARALTPVGTFTIERRIPGVVDAYFGTLYDPMYFHSGWAIHGSGNVPPVPASHGCVRLPRADAAWLYEQVDIGTVVVVRGTRNAFDPARGESAGTDRPAGEVQPPPAPPPPPPPNRGTSG